MTSSPALGSTARFPSVLKKKLPLKSGVMRSTEESTLMNPGFPPRCDTSTPLVALSLVSALDAMKNVSLRRISPTSSLDRLSDQSSRAAVLLTVALSERTYRAWIYCGQLP